MPALEPLPQLLTAFVATMLLGFVIGLQLHSYRREAGPDLGFGTTRTLTLLALLGFALWALDPTAKLYAAGLALLAVLLGIYYWHRAKSDKLSLLPSLIAVLVYGLGPIAISQPLWFLVLYVVTIIVMLGEQLGIRRLSDAFPGAEALTLAKFLIMLGVVLPLLPRVPVGPLFGNLTWDGVWLAVVAVSALSYLSYLAQRYFAREHGLLLTGLLGGLYSSTAVTVVLARRGRESADFARRAAPAIVIATAMMYLRLWTIIFVLGHRREAWQLALPFSVGCVSSLLVAFFLQRRAPSGKMASGTPIEPDAVSHPLELPTAFLFALLLVVFVGLTGYALQTFGSSGLSTLSVLAGFGDVDAYVLALLAGKFQLGIGTIATAIVLASGSNNLVKAGCAIVLGRRRELRLATAWLLLLFAASVAYAYLAV